VLARDAHADVLAVEGVQLFEVFEQDVADFTAAAAPADVRRWRR
jgi:hypothetical protein